MHHVLRSAKNSNSQVKSCLTRFYPAHGYRDHFLWHTRQAINFDIVQPTIQFLKEVPNKVAELIWQHKELGCDIKKSPLTNKVAELIWQHKELGRDIKKSPLTKMYPTVKSQGISVLASSVPLARIVLTYTDPRNNKVTFIGEFVKILSIVNHGWIELNDAVFAA